MALKNKRKFELENHKLQRKEEVISSALDVFKEQGIEKTKMTDIAEKSSVGVASIYRYFKTKPDLAIEAACKFWKDEINDLYIYYSTKDFLNKDGITKVKEILEVFLKLYRNHQDFIRFIDEFDRYIIKENIPKEKLKAYEKSITDLKPLLLDALASGKDDGTIRTDLSSEHFYFSITHSLMSLCQKLVLRGNVLESNKNVQNEEQIRIIIEMAVNYVK